MTNSLFSGNSAQSGGAAFIYTGGGNGFSNCVFISNSAVSNGGALVLPTYVKIWNSSFTSNQAFTGGACINGGFSDCNFVGNRATSSGGAIYLTPSSLVSSNCVFIGNQCHTNGGAVYSGIWSNCAFNGNSAGQNGGAGYNCTMENSVLSENSALFGGGVNNGALTQCLLTRNRAQVGGGANNSSAYLIRNSTITDNYATNTAGGLFGNCSAVSSIIYFNSAPTSNNYSGIYPSTCCLYPLPTSHHSSIRSTETSVCRQARPALTPEPAQLPSHSIWTVGRA
jgi:predicted outer membrane repeat protein